MCLRIETASICSNSGPSSSQGGSSHRMDSRSPANPRERCLLTSRRFACTGLGLSGNARNTAHPPHSCLYGRTQSAGNESHSVNVSGASEHMGIPGNRRKNPAGYPAEPGTNSTPFHVSCHGRPCPAACLTDEPTSRYRAESAPACSPLVPGTFYWTPFPSAHAAVLYSHLIPHIEPLRAEYDIPPEHHRDSPPNHVGLPAVEELTWQLVRQPKHAAQRPAPPRYVFRGPARGPLASGPGMTVSPCPR